MAEKGVRFIQLYHRGWDQHSNLPKRIREQCKDTDQPSAALIQDLKARGMLEDTLVIWGGEFGRTPMTEGTDGRDHDPYGFTTVFAGGGVKGGQIIGRTDEFGLKAIEDRAHVHDIHATILHALGFDHTRLTFPYNGRDERLTETAGNVVTKLFG